MEFLLQLRDIPPKRTQLLLIGGKFFLVNFRRQIGGMLRKRNKSDIRL